MGEHTATLLTKFIHMMFHDGDPTRPNCFEHYNPVTGQPSVYRGIDDYQHSWVLDLLLRGVAGLEPTPRGLRIDPLPLDLASVSVAGALVRGRRIAVSGTGAEIRVEMDGSFHETRVGEALIIPW